MESLVAQVKSLASSADETGRRTLQTVLRDLAYSLEGYDDTVHRIGYYHLQTSAVRVGIDLGIFEMLSESHKPLRMVDLAESTGADPLLLGRLLRYISSVGMVTETQQDVYKANNVTTNLAVKGNQAGINHCFETIGPQYQEMPTFLRKINYQNVSDPHHSVFQDAWKTNLGAFDWFQYHPENLEYFNQYMASRREGAETWLSVYPIEEETRLWDPEAAVFINMGGGIGHQCAEFKARYPKVAGRVILQDLPHSIDRALQTPGVENMTHNFFEPQPIKGAKFYFLRGVLHNHPDDKVRLILRNIMSAMSKNSVILIDEMVLPDTNVNWHVTSIDLSMMCAFGARERTEAQWLEILESVGLQISKKLVYKPAVYETVMAVIPA
uniref:Putative O-methyltransferase n=1 Tax=Cladonia uncialis subsp. uncialis TaxID=180999 RepID=A0A1Z1C4T7_CLAUC|nr:putative O-methyltransferase [Cladonia uncialis subsp. uncialis]AUW30806.1 putative O-methyltransferase [Cladonia uncialis subsp. uncialis]